MFIKLDGSLKPFVLSLKKDKIAHVVTLNKLKLVL